MQKRKNKKKKRYLAIPLQCLIVSVQLLITLSMLSYTFYTITDSVSGSDEAYRQSHMQKLAAGGEYGDLCDYLVLYRYYGEEYQDYWTLIDAARLSSLHRAAVSAACRSQTPELAVHYQEVADQSYQKLSAISSGLQNQTAGKAVKRIQEELLSERSESSSFSSVGANPN